MCLSHISCATHADPQVDPFALAAFTRSCMAMVLAMKWYLSKALDGPNAIIHAGTQEMVRGKLDEIMKSGTQEMTVVHESIIGLDSIEPDLAHFEILNETSAKL